MCRLGLMKEPYLFGKARNGQGCCTVWMFTGWRNYPILYAIWVISGSTPAHVAANFKHDTPSTPSHVTCPFPKISWGNVRFTPVQQHSCVCFARHIATKYIATSGDLSFGSDIGIACILATAVKKNWPNHGIHLMLFWQFARNALARPRQEDLAESSQLALAPGIKIAWKQEGKGRARTRVCVSCWIRL